MSPKTTPTITVLAMILVVLMIANNNLSITEAVDTTVTSDYCGEVHYEAGDPYGDGVIGLLNLLAGSTENVYRYNNDMEATVEQTGVVIYGHAECRETLEPEECGECMEEAEAHLLENCAMSIFAFVELVDCSMKYNNGPFTG